MKKTLQEYNIDRASRAQSLLVFLISTTLFGLCVFPKGLNSEDKPSRTRPNVSGEIELETVEQKKDPYLITQEATLTYFKELKGALLSVSSNGKKVLLPDAKSVHYLSGLYLFCTIKKGVCPAILESLFEIDLVNSRLNNVAVCPLMKSFWKTYLDNDFEDRVKYGTSTAFIAKVNEFNAKERPKFLRCDETLKGIFKDGTAPAALFSARYAPQSPAIKSIDEVIALINKVTENDINVFVATGSQQ